MTRWIMSTAMAVALLCAAGGAAWADQAAAVQAVRSKPGVIDALVDNAGILYVSVKNDTRVPWDQYARYMCEVVRPHQARIFKIRVVDVTQVAFSKKPQDWKRLSEASCGN